MVLGDRVKVVLLVLVLALLVCGPGAAMASPEPKPRLLVLTDIGGDPDDQQSMVRLLVHANEFQIEGLIASASGTPGELKERVTKPQLIREQIEAYAKVLPNLQRHAAGFPDAARLLALVKSGNTNRGREFIGEGHDTEGSRWIISCAEKDDPRPLNIVIWGGQTDFAQALWGARQERSAENFKRFLGRLRVFDIGDQDKIQDWIFREFPDLFYVLAKAPTGADMRQGAYRGMYLGGDESLTSLAWLDEHVRKKHGPLGALYPPKTWTAPNPNSALKEGDTPSWFFFLHNGLSDSEHPEWGGWGGRYLKQSGGLYRDAQDRVGDVMDARTAVWRWRPAFQAEFAARMDWCVSEDIKKANHAPVAALNGDSSRRVLEINGRPGEQVALSAKGSTDPDGNALALRWFIYPEPSVNAEGAQLSSSTGETVYLSPSRNQLLAVIHVVVEATDNGTPPLTSYRRAIVNCRPSSK